MNMRSYNCCDKKSEAFKGIKTLSTLLKLLSEKNRLKLLCLLKDKEHCVCEVLECFDMSQSLVSHHLADLKDAGLVKDLKEGRKVFYSLTKKGHKIIKIIFSIKEEL